jgi:hypothetical protein
MFIDENWSVLTVGDGDLSFSRAIFEQYKPKKLTSTILDTKTELCRKYGNEHYTYLTSNGCEVFTEFDVTNLSCVQQLQKKYDLVIFQFPLVPNFLNQNEFYKYTQGNKIAFSINTLNRRLLRLYLIHSFEYLLSATGSQLAYISSKDVKPYIEWDIEYSLTKGTELTCIGSIPFSIEQFPGYKIRNVDRDKHVKDTGALTYIWTRENPNQSVYKNFDLITPKTELFGNKGCDVCHAGPFATEQEKTEHLSGKKHNRMDVYDSQWQEYLALNDNVVPD